MIQISEMFRTVARICIHLIKSNKKEEIGNVKLTGNILNPETGPL